MVRILKDKILEFHPDTVECVRKEVNLEKEGRIEEAVDILEEWVKKQPHFVKKDFSREYLESTLITSKGMVERAKQKIDKLCTLKTLMPEMFANTSKTEFQELFKYLNHAHLPKLTKENYRVYFFKLKSDDFEMSSVTKYYKYLMLIFEYLKRYDYNSGIVTFMDMRNVNILNFVSKCTPLELRQFIVLMTEGYGLRLKDIHLISSSKMIDALLGLLKQVLSSKLSQRIHLHKSIDTIYEFVSKDILPEEYGGKERSLQTLNEEWMDLLTSKDFMQYIEEMFGAKTDESCRQATKFNEEYIGMPGSFRALSVD